MAFDVHGWHQTTRSKTGNGDKSPHGIPCQGAASGAIRGPTAGVAGTGVGAFLVTMMWGVRRGLFSNEAGQGSAPIAHAAAKTRYSVREGADATPAGS